MPEGFRADYHGFFGVAPELLTPRISAEFREQKKKKKLRIVKTEKKIKKPEPEGPGAL